MKKSERKHIELEAHCVHILKLIPVSPLQPGQIDEVSSAFCPIVAPLVKDIEGSMAKQQKSESLLKLLFLKLLFSLDRPGCQSEREG